MAVSFVVELLGYLLFILAAALQLVITIVPEWSISDSSNEIMEWRKNYKGLWWQCTGQQTGDFTCNDYDSFILGASTVQIVCRACMVIAIILNLVAFCVMQPALIWVQCLTNDLLRYRFLFIALFCKVCSFAAVIIGTGWYARYILDEYKVVTQNGLNQNVMIFGNCLYVAWISLIFHFGAIVCFGLVVTKGTNYNGKMDSSSYGNYTRESIVSSQKFHPSYQRSQIPEKLNRTEYI